MPQKRVSNHYLFLPVLLIAGILAACSVVQADDNQHTLSYTDTSDMQDQVETTPESTASPTETPIPTPTSIAFDDDDYIIVIEGPVSAINVNIITIYNFNIAIEPTSPILQVIQIGDVIHISGIANWLVYHDDDDDDDDFPVFAPINQTIINITIINIQFINVNIVILGDLIWRDPGDCRGIPSWVSEADATDYFRRCFRPATRPSAPRPSRPSNNDDDDDDD